VVLRGRPVLLGVVLLVAWRPSYWHHYSAGMGHNRLTTDNTGYRNRGLSVRLQIAWGQVAIVASRADVESGMRTPPELLDAAGWSFTASNDIFNQKRYGNLGGPGMFAAKAWTHPDSGRFPRSSSGVGFGIPVWFAAALLIVGPTLRRNLLRRSSQSKAASARTGTDVCHPQRRATDGVARAPQMPNA
jgi:hypothetical protein